MKPLIPVLAALAFPAQRWRRDRVMALVSGAPVRHDGELARPAAWETISREAGVVHDLGDWRRRLEVHRSSLQRHLDHGFDLVRVKRLARTVWP